MRQGFNLFASAVGLLLCVLLAAQSANAQKRYPSADDPWDATDYRALVQRIEDNGLALPTLSGTKSVFERMVANDNIPFHMGRNPDLAITVRYQKLEPILRPLDKLVELYSNGAQKGKPYASELARLRVYRAKAAAALLEIGEPYLKTLRHDVRYKTHVALMNQIKNNAREFYSGLVASMGETSRYSKSDILYMSKGALNAISAYQPIFTNQDRAALTQTLAKQISAAGDQQVKSALTELHDAIKHGRIPA